MEPTRSPYSAFSPDGHVARWATWNGEADETLTLTWENEGWTASGIVGRERVQYVIRLSSAWQVRQFLLFRDLDEPDLWLATDGSSRWGEMNGAHRTELDGCYDIDLPCTPFSRTVPIRRLPLHIGHTADVAVARVDVNTLEVLAVPLRYTRADRLTWRVTDSSTGDVEEFEVDEHGLVRDLPGAYRRIG